ncbi:MAG TPA: F0F1 ATP synthase subunit A [Acidimicrobiales bacterium]|nr:F0F1 ATP synthase subunit A [Acidimicrobiales bacterium]
MGGLLHVLPANFVLGDISVGEHVNGKLFGLSVNWDTIWATGAALLVVVALGIALRRQVTSGVPGRLQLVFETGVQAVTKQVEGSIGPRGMSVIPLAVALFVFILVCNFFEIFGLGSRYEFLLTPTADINLPLAMAILVILLVHIASIRVRGPVGYVKHYLTQPFPIFLLPFNLFINLVEEIAKPITLALRLFGNLFSGALMLSLIAALGVWKLGGIPIGDFFTFFMSIIWKLFDVFLIGPIQAFIFALLTILYFDTAMSDVH